MHHDRTPLSPPCPLASLATFAAGLALSAAGCNTASPLPAPSAPPGVAMQRLTVTSKSFASNGPIPVDYTCDGADRSPQITWSAAPSGTQSFALLAVDPDASGGEFVHWVAFNLKPDATAVPEGADVGDLGGLPGTNGFNRTGYSGPCPPKMELHTYAFRVYALDAMLPPRAGLTAEALSNAMSGHVLAQGTLTGRFSH